MKFNWAQPVLCGVCGAEMVLRHGRFISLECPKSHSWRAQMDAYNERLERAKARGAKEMLLGDFYEELDGWKQKRPPQDGETSE